jgi:hypothetical protein
MAFVAGYLSGGPQYTTKELTDRVGSFSILPREPAAYAHRVVTISNGHLLIKHRTTYPVPPRIDVDEQGNTLATLGFVFAGPQDALTACVATGGRALDDREGEFVAAFADAASGTLHLVNDRFATRPCYVRRTADAVYFSSNLAWLFVLARERYCTVDDVWLDVL